MGLRESHRRLQHIDLQIVCRGFRELFNTRGGGGGYSLLTPNFGRYVPRQSEKLARAPERAPGWAWKWGSPERAWAVLSLKMGGSGTSLIRFSVKMGLSGTARTCLANPRRWKWDRPELPGRVWLTRSCWKWDSPELPGRVWLTRGAAFGLSQPWKEIFLMMVSGTAKSAQKM